MSDDCSRPQRLCSQPAGGRLLLSQLYGQGRTELDSVPAECLTRTRSAIIQPEGGYCQDWSRVVCKRGTSRGPCCTSRVTSGVVSAKYAVSFTAYGWLDVGNSTSLENLQEHVVARVDLSRAHKPTCRPAISAVQVTPSRVTSSRRDRRLRHDAHFPDLAIPAIPAKSYSLQLRSAKRNATSPSRGQNTIVRCASGASGCHSNGLS